MIHNLQRFEVLRTFSFLIMIYSILGLIGSPAYALSDKKAYEIGKEMYDEIINNMPIYKEPELNKYVNNIGQLMAAKTGANNVDYIFTIIDSPDINAFATPGGFVYINRGLINYLNSEAELAAVLGHEVGHVAADHSGRQKRADTVKNVISTVLAVATQVTVGAGGNEIGEISNYAGTAVVSGYGREHELEADRLGANYLYKANYDPQAMERVIGILKNHEQFSRIKARQEGKKSQAYHGVFASHPRNDKRLREVIAEAGSLDEGAAITNEWIFRQQITGLEFGNDSVDGTRIGNRFYHKMLDFTLAFPTGWKMQNSPNAVVSYPNRQDAFLQLQIKGVDKELTAEEFIRTEMKVDNMTEGERITLDGLEGYTGIVPATEKRGPVRVAAVVYKNRGYYFTGVNRKPNAAFNYDVFFKATINSFRRLAPEDYPLAAKMKIKFIKVDNNTRYSDLARSSVIGKYALEQLRLLNDDYPNGEPEPGEWIKIVE